MTLLADERLTQIVALLTEHGSLRTTELAARLKVSGATLRRDLDTLRQRGVIEKVHGGARLASQDQLYLERQQLNQPGKRALAKAALLEITPHQTVYLDAGTTALDVAQTLKTVPTLLRTLRIVTHAIDVAYELNGECDLYVIGGEVYGSTYSLTGPDALATLGQYSYDLFFVGCTSINGAGQLTNSNRIEAQQKSAIMERASRTVLIADGSKWGQAGFAPFAHLRELSGWVTDEAPAEALAACQSWGVTVRQGKHL